MQVLKKKKPQEKSQGFNKSNQKIMNK